MKRFSALAGLGLLAACTYVDTGQIDYRIAEPPPVRVNQTVAERCENAPETSCDPLLPARVDRRYLPDLTDQGRPFSSREVYSIEIEQGVIGANILEGNILGRQFGTTGEFAILANVFEFSSDEAGAPQRRFLESGEYSASGDDPSDVELKLIYYSDDVRRNQPFNFSNIPLRPRTAYNGGSIGIQIVIIETDVQAGPVGSMLTTLARFGQQAIPGPSELTDALFDLGESLFSGSGSDDRLFEYRFVLSAPTGDRQAVQATFTPGRYVLRRGQNRSSPIIWNNVRLDHNTARLFRANTNEEVRDELYLVLNIRRYPEGTAPEHYMQQDWTAFRQQLQQAADTQAAPITAVTANLQEALGQRRSAEWRARLSGKWAAIESALRFQAASTVSNLGSLDLTMCTVEVTELERARQLSTRMSRDRIREFIADYQAALRPVGTPATVEFNADDRAAMVSRLARYFMPWDSASDEQKFADTAGFEAAFVTANPTDLADLATATATARGRSATGCSDLLAGVPRL